nr:MAG TPA: hypothetical protein [Caudoviricetes sp.]
MKNLLIYYHYQSRRFWFALSIILLFFLKPFSTKFIKIENTLKTIVIS